MCAGKEGNQKGQDRLFFNAIQGIRHRRFSWPKLWHSLTVLLCQKSSSGIFVAELLTLLNGSCQSVPLLTSPPLPFVRWPCGRVGGCCPFTNLFQLWSRRTNLSDSCLGQELFIYASAHTLDCFVAAVCVTFFGSPNLPVFSLRGGWRRKTLVLMRP